MWINKFIGILIAINQKPPKDITEGILFLLISETMKRLDQPLQNLEI
jgi:hypothetical protein